MLPVNDLSKIVRLSDSRMDLLDKDAVFERSKVKYDILKFMRCGTECKFELEFDEQIFIVRPLSIKEENEIEGESLKIFHETPDYKRTPRLLDYLTMTRILSSAMSPCPEQPEKFRLAELCAMPTYYVIGLYKQYVELCKQLNPDIDRLTAERVEELIGEIEHSPKLVNDCTVPELRAICLELLRINTILQAK
jgi:hypothetical protein